ncbi:MAG: hypothetical protein HKP58_07205 [Desulfatitalea sp.]|nr:hypothetical protein [Desulfatitalea sp.]
MITNRLFYATKVLAVISFLLLVTLPLIASAAQVQLQWDANDPAPEGYRLFQRTDGSTYDYSQPVWSGTTATCSVDNLVVGDTYHFVVRAFVGGDESVDSNEVAYTAVAEPPPVVVDSDGDGYDDISDAFPQDSYEWVDTDGDGVGNNGDLDDDGDGLPDTWEVLHGTNPLIDDADQDVDGDGITNIEEYLYTAPDQPLLNKPIDGAAHVDLTPILITHVFSDADGDNHTATCYQISTTEDFSSLVYEKTTQVYLERIRIPELILEPDTTYYWRVKFFDHHGYASEWSESNDFTTIDHATAGDLDGDGIFDDQRLGGDADLDGDGTSDVLQSGLQGVVTEDAYNPQVAVKRIGGNAQLVGVRALDMDTLEVDMNQAEKMSGVISFKLYLTGDTATTSVTVWFSQPAPENAQWYKYDQETGWSVQDQAVFSADRMSVTLQLEDGGDSDEDGVRNGIIVDPCGLGYDSHILTPSPTSPGTVLEDAIEAGTSGCFISTQMDGARKDAKPIAAGLFLIIGWMIVSVSLRISAQRRGMIKKRLN